MTSQDSLSMTLVFQYCYLETRVCMDSVSRATACIAIWLHKSFALKACAQPGAVQTACDADQIAKD